MQQPRLGKENPDEAARNAPKDGASGGTRRCDKGQHVLAPREREPPKKALCGLRKVY